MQLQLVGALPFQYEKAVEQWYATGGQTITDEVNAYYAANK